MIPKFFAVLCLFLFCSHTLFGQCTRVELVVTDDTYVCTDPTAPDLNYGSEPLMFVENDSGVRHCLALIKFDIGSLPSNPCSSVLQLTGTGEGFLEEVDTLNIRILDPNDPWSEDTVTYGTDPFPKPDPLLVFLQPTMYKNTAEGETESFDITALVQHAKSQGFSELGLQLDFTGDDINPTRAFWSTKEGTTAPKLITDGSPFTVTAGPITSSGKIPYEGEGRVGHFTIEVSANASEAVDFDQLTVAFSDEGREGTSATTTRVYLDQNEDGIIDGGDTLLDSQTLSQDNQIVNFDLSALTVNVGDEAVLLVSILTNDLGCPNEFFITTVTDLTGDGAQTGLDAIYVGRPDAQGAGRISIGNLDIAGGNNQSNVQGATWPEPLQVTVSGRNFNQGQCQGNDTVAWAVLQGPNGGDLTLAENITTIQPDGSSEVALNPAQVPGEYLISAIIGGPFTDFDSVIFTVTVTGMTVDIQHDGNPDGLTIGTFIPGIQAENLFQIQVESGGAAVTGVSLNLNGAVTNATNNGNTWSATLDMSDLPQGAASLVITAEDGARAVVAQRTYTMEALDIPAWFSLPGLEKSFDAGQQTYELDLSLPTDPSNPFNWTGFEIPEIVELIGGSDNDAGGDFSVETRFHINRTVSFGAAGGVDTTIFGQPVSFSADLSVDFDENLDFQGGNGSINASASFELPEKGASRTVIVYGVPITVAVDLGGTVEVFVNGSLVFDQSLEIEQIQVQPGIGITIDLTLSASLFFGIAKLEFLAHPNAVVSMTVNWNQTNGTQGTFNGDFTIPFELVGSIFWGAGSGTLAEGELGPWSFGTGRKKRDPIPNSGIAFVPSAAIDASGSTLLAVSVENTGTDESPNPEVMARFSTGAGWDNPVSITSDQEDHWESDPAVRFIAGGSQAIAVWTSNDADPALANGGLLSQIFSGQDIDYSLWNGSSWSAPGAVVDDATADGSPHLAGHPSLSEAICVWVQDADGTPALPGSRGDTEIPSRDDWTIRYSHYQSGSWSTPATAAKLNAADAVREPKVHYGPAGQALLVFSRDLDGRPETVGDASVMASWWDGDFDTIFTLSTEPNLIGETAPTALFRANGDGLVVWHGRREPDGGGDPVEEALFASAYDSGTDTWTTAVELFASETFIQKPELSLDENGDPVLYYVGFDGYDGDLFQADIDLDALLAGLRGDPVLGDPTQLTNDDQIDRLVGVAPGTNAPNVLWFSGNFEDGQASGGLAGGLNFASSQPLGTLQSAAIITDTPDLDMNNRFDEILVQVNNIIISGNASFCLSADLTGLDPEDPGRRQRIATVTGQAQNLTPGNHNLTLSFDGSVINNFGLDGPYQIGPIRLLQKQNHQASIVVDTINEGPLLSNLTAEEFELGPLTWDRDLYTRAESGTLTLNDPSLNQDNLSAETVQISVNSTIDPEGTTAILTETAVDSGIFEGQVSFSFTARGDAVQVDQFTILQAVSTTGQATATATAQWRDLSRDPCVDADLNDRLNVLDLVYIVDAVGSDDDLFDFDLSGTVTLDDFQFAVPCWQTE